MEAIAHSMFESLALTFPVACASDEFFYFPQVRLSQQKWDTWDNFSQETVSEFDRKLSAWENGLDILRPYVQNQAARIDMAILQKLAHTLREQLSEVRSWESLPTFYLTLTCRSC